MKNHLLELLSRVLRSIRIPLVLCNHFYILLFKVLIFFVLRVWAAMVTLFQIKTFIWYCKIFVAFKYFNLLSKTAIHFLKFSAFDIFNLNWALIIWWFTCFGILGQIWKSLINRKDILTKFNEFRVFIKNVCLNLVFPKWSTLRLKFL